MNKKTLKITTLFLSLTTLSLVMGTIITNNVSLTSSTDNSSWVHYKKKEASATSDGIREYWVSCGGGYRFSKPDSTNIKEATNYDTSGFSANDPRYIKYISSDKSAFYALENKTFDLNEITSLTGYSTSGASSVIGETSRLEFYKDDNSPMYSANCLTVNGTISTNTELNSLQEKILAGNESGYYVLTKDLTSPNSVITTIGDNVGIFSGIFDGRNHTISNPSFWNKRMFGSLKKATIRNINFTNIKIFSVLAVAIYDSLIENVNFEMSDTVNSYSNVGMICDSIYGSTKFKDLVVNYKNTYHYYPNGKNGTSIFAAYNYTKIDNQTFENVTVKCLSSVTMFNADYYGRSLRPTDGITYVPMYYFIKNGTLNYNIQYLEGDSSILEAATELKSAIYQITGKTISLVSFNSEEFIDKDTPSIVLGCDDALSCYLVDLPTDEGEYVIKTIGKAIYINSADQYGWEEAILQFLSYAFDYDYYGDGVTSNNVKDKNNIDIFCINIRNITPFTYRRADWGDGYNNDMYLLGYNVTGYSSNDLYINVPGHSDDPHLKSTEKFHTMLRILYPGLYVNDHPKWFATDILGTLPSKVNDSYYTWQPCFTAHGNSSEYTLMVQTAADNIIEIFANNTNLSINNICFAIGDSYNSCSCYTCRKKTTDYGSISGTLVNFVNDVATLVNSRANETNREKILFSTFAYTSYRTAPVKNNEATIKCVDNVSILLAPIEANYTYSLGDSTHNEEANTMIENWSKVGNLSCWLYDTNFSHYLFPYNSFKSMTETITYFKDKNVNVMYIEGQHNLRPQRRTGFNQLKKYLNAKFMVNSKYNYDELLNKFFVNYFGNTGSTYMRTFFNEMVSRLESFETDSTLNNYLTKNGSLKSIYAAVDDYRLWDKDQLVRWVGLCTTAYNAETNSKTKEHILAESIFPRFNLCSNFGDQFSSSEILTMRQNFKKDAASLDVTILMENNQVTLQSYYDSWGV